MSTQLFYDNEDVLVAKDDKGKEYYVGIYHDDDYYDYEWSQHMDPVGELITWHRNYSIGQKHKFEDPEAFWKDFFVSRYGYYADKDRWKENAIALFKLMLSHTFIDIWSKEALEKVPVDVRHRTTLDSPYYLCRIDREANLAKDGVWYELSTNDVDKFNDDDIDAFWETLDYLYLGEYQTMAKYVPDVVFFNVYMYEHGGIALSLSNSTYPFNDPWDSGWLGIWYCTKQDAKESGWDVDNEDWKAGVSDLIKGRIDEFNYVESGYVWGFAYADKEQLDATRAEEGDESWVSELRDNIRATSINDCWSYVGEYKEQLEDFCESEGLELVDVFEE